ncbi:putative nuclease HARBI1 [Planococcus citri]|uniref:putative nuclease HARBI1 n=1 Tax=Planococcus citri TaxID=170843 RepID=UPI0031F9A8E1
MPLQRFNVTLQMVGVPRNRRRNNRTRDRYDLRQNREGCYLDLEEDQFISQFRLKKSVFHHIVDIMRPYIRVGTTKRSLSAERKVLAVLRFLAQGGYQASVGNEYEAAIAQSTVSVVLNEVIDAMNLLICPRFIKFPSIEGLKRTAHYFQHKKKLRIPGIIGAVDGTHISIVGPKDDAEHPEFIYVNRKHFHSINVQIISDHNYKILNVNAKFPGSSHDSFISKQSQIRRHLSDNFADTRLWLLGDSGYPLEPWLMVPFKSPDTPGEELFNNYHARCRSTVERCVLKGRWRCLKQERGLHYHPVTASKIINACVALHNICIDTDDSYCDIEIEEDVQLAENAVVNATDPLHVQGSEIRNSLIAYVL